MEERNSEEVKTEKKKKSKSTTIVITLLLLVILGLVGYICYDKGIIFESKEKEVNETNNKTDKVTVEDYDLAKAKELLIRHGFTSETGPVRYLSGTVYEFGYDEQYKAYIAISNISKNNNLQTTTCQELIKDTSLNYKNDYGQLTISDSKNEDFFGACYDDMNDGLKLISYDLVNKEYKKLYGTDLEKKSYSFDVSPYLYSQKYDAFVLLSCECGGTWGPSIHIDEIKDAKLENDTLTIHVYNEIIKATDNNDILYFYIENTSYDTKEKTVDAIEQDIVANHLDLINLYEIKFEKKGDNYIFKSLSQVLS